VAPGAVVRGSGDEAIGWDREIEGGFGGILDDGRAVFLHERQRPEDATDAVGAFLTVDVIRYSADRRPDALGRRQQRERFGWRAARAIRILDAMPPARGAQMLAEQLASLRIERPDNRSRRR
jgi:hypothetical protein